MISIHNHSIINYYPNFQISSPSKLIASPCIMQSSGMQNGCRGFESIKDEGKKHGWGGRGSCIKPLCSKVSRTFSHGDSSRLITNSKASSPTGGNTQPRLFVPVLLPLLRPTFRCFRNEIGPLLSPFPSHRPQTCYCSSLIREPRHNNWSIS